MSNEPSSIKEAYKSDWEKLWLPVIRQVLIDGGYDPDETICDQPEMAKAMKELDPLHTE